jgi:3-methyl-2-oxobutanoate hydroxymethyltransferase
MTVPAFLARKGGPRLTVLTCYDHPTATIFDQAGIDALLVGDSVGTTVQGLASTVPVTMDQMVYHSTLVSRAAKRALVIADLPFLSHQPSLETAIRNAGRLVQEGGAAAVKLEGGVRSAEAIAAIVRSDIPVMGHVGLTPQSIHKLGRYRVERDEDRLLADARAVEQAGAFSIVLEGVPATLAAKVTEALAIPTIGIGAGPNCDGQVLVWHDALGMFPDFTPKFVRRFANLHQAMTDGVLAFKQAVESGRYPDDATSYR